MDEQVPRLPLTRSPNQTAIEKEGGEKEVMTARGGRLSERGERNIFFVCRAAVPRISPIRAEDGEGERNHLTPLPPGGCGECKLDIKTQIAFRKVTGCQKILDAPLLGNNNSHQLLRK